MFSKMIESQQPFLNHSNRESILNIDKYFICTSKIFFNFKRLRVGYAV